MGKGIICVVWVSVLFVWGCGPKKQENKSGESEISGKPNIIYILADDLGYGDIGVYGQEQFGTPNIDNLAQHGLLFTQHYAGSTVCAPSRSALMTGLHTGHTFIRGNKSPGEEGQFPLKAAAITIAEVLRKAGYATGAFGKWGLGFVGTEGDPNNQGFDQFYGYNCQGLAHRYYPTHLWENGNKILLEGNDTHKTSVYAPDLIHAKTLDFIKEQANNPFFLYIPSVIPHAELIAPKDSIWEAFENKYNENPWGTDNTSGSRYQGNDYGSTNYHPKGYASQERPRATFASMVTRLDRQVGEIVQLLEDLGIAENTLIIFTSDNGPHVEGGADPTFFNSSGAVRGNKRDLYEGGIRVPMIAKWLVAIEGGQQTDHVSAFWDILPTLAELAGTEIPEHTDGISLVPTLKGVDGQAKHDHLYWEFHEQNGKQAIRMGNWKGIRLNVYDDPRGPIELYDLSKDIRELNNVAEDYPEVVAQIEELMETSRTENDDFPFNRQ